MHSTNIKKPDTLLFHYIQKGGEEIRQGKADRKLDGRKKCDVKLGNVTQNMKNYI